MNLKPPISYDEQLKKLEEHGLILDKNKKDYYLKVIKNVNYYRFTGYALQYRKEENDSDFIDGTTFEKVYHIYQFDEKLRHILRKYIEVSEIYFRSLIAYNFSMAKCMKPPHDQHYDEYNYFNKKGVDEVLDTFKKEKNYYKDSLIVKHHKEKYSNKMPLWVMVELMSFSNLSKLYSCMYYSEKDLIASACGTTRNVLTNNLHCLSVLRNKCAHGAKLYNSTYSPPAVLSVSFLKKNPTVRNDTLFAYLIVLLKRLPDETNRAELCNEILELTREYKDMINLELIGFPENYEELLNYK